MRVARSRKRPNEWSRTPAIQEASQRLHGRCRVTSAVSGRSVSAGPLDSRKKRSQLCRGEEIWVPQNNRAVSHLWCFIA